MAQQSINIGTNPNDGTGDPLRTAFSKCNSNFTDLYTTAYATNVVNSFNTRVGAVTLTLTDVTTALTYTPANKAGDTFTGLAVFNAGWVSNNTGSASLNAATLSTLPAAPTGTVLRAIQVDGVSSRISVDSFVSTNPGAGFTMRGARGTGASPSAISSTDIIGSLVAHGYGATSFQTSSTGAIEFIAEGSGLFTDVSQPTAIAFLVTPNSSIAKAEKMRLTSAGVLTLAAGTNATSSSTGTLVLSGSGGIGVGGNVNIAGSLTAGSGTYYAINTVTVATVLTSAYRYVNVSTGGLTMTLPNAVGNQGLVISIKNLVSGTTTIATGGGNIDGSTTNNTLLTTHYAAKSFVSDGTNWWSY
jgi:hypothetical protein